MPCETESRRRWEVLWLGWGAELHPPQGTGGRRAWRASRERAPRVVWRDTVFTRREVDGKRMLACEEIYDIL
jgi:hypothetical protein